MQGCYIRWCDYDVIGVNLCVACTIFFRKSDYVILIQPCCGLYEKQKLFAMLKECLESRHIRIKCVANREIPQYLDEADWIVFVDEEERRAMHTLLAEFLQEDSICGKLITCSRVIENLNYNIVGSYLRGLKERGVEILTLNFITSQYYKSLNNKILNKYRMDGREINGKLYESMYQSFFADLYTKDYAKAIIGIEYAAQNENGILKLKDCRSPFYNVTDGERNTIGQPEVFTKSIYFYGPCIIYGHYVEDSNTIESFLQNYLNEIDSSIRVVNYGSPGYNRQPIVELAHILNTPMKQGDVVVLYLDGWQFEGIRNLNLMNILENYDISEDWLVEAPSHCNHKINKLYAKAILDVVMSFTEGTAKQDEIKPDSYFIKKLYIDRYFSDFEVSKYQETGAIVMNCNPFTNGHRYLIEKALEIVDFLIIFVVEEDRSFFHFDERFSMVCSCVEEFENVMVVPSGPFILSQVTFPEYFIKIHDEDIAQNAENDIMVFAKYIAPYLNIKYRFVGEEPMDIVTREYNIAMKKILPLYGIRLIEIPRKKIQGEYISATYVRNCLVKGKTEVLANWLPEPVRRKIGLII